MLLRAPPFPWVDQAVAAVSMPGRSHLQEPDRLFAAMRDSGVGGAFWRNDLAGDDAHEDAVLRWISGAPGEPAGAVVAALWKRFGVASWYGPARALSHPLVRGPLPRPFAAATASADAHFPSAAHAGPLGAHVGEALAEPAVGVLPADVGAEAAPALPPLPNPAETAPHWSKCATPCQPLFTNCCETRASFLWNREMWLL